MRLIITVTGEDEAFLSQISNFFKGVPCSYISFGPSLLHKRPLNVVTKVMRTVTLQSITDAVLNLHIRHHKHVN